LVRLCRPVSVFAFDCGARIAVVVVDGIERFVAKVDISHLDIVIVKVAKLLQSTLEEFVFVQSASDPTFTEAELARG
jgi:hypothetical protein